MALAWHVATLEPNKGLIAERAVKATGYAVFNPKEIITRQMSRGRTRKITKLILPGYMLISFDSAISGWQRLNRLPGSGIRSLMYAAPEVPAAVSDTDLLPLLSLCGPDDILITKTAEIAKVRVGDLVKVIEGAFASFSGIVKNVHADGRVKVAVQIFGRSTPVELQSGMYEKS